MRVIAIVLVSIVMASSAYATESTNTYISTDLGISIDVPVSQAADCITYQVAAFFLPPSDNFAANVNIQKQRYPDDMKSYNELSVNQFKHYGMTILNHTANKNEAVYEYKGEMQGRTMHWYARAIKTDGYVYLVTGTCLETTWKQQRSIIMKSVNSFKVK